MSDEGDFEERAAAAIGPAVLVLLVAALVIAATGHWRGGIDLLGITMLSGGAGRLVLPRRTMGNLAVRHRFVDALLLLSAGTALIVLVYIVPTT